MTEKQILDMPALIKTSHFIYGGMTLLGLLVIHFGHGNLPQLFAPRTEHMPIYQLFLSVLLATGFLLILSVAFEDLFHSYRNLKDEIVAILGRATLWEALYLALVSAIGEELLFRGAIQPYLGLTFTSLIFGLLHLGPTSGLSAWTLWAFVAGLLLGWMVEESGLLWPSILTHFLVNGTSLNLLRYEFKRRDKKAGDATRTP